MDMGSSEAGMFVCENGHTVCESHQIERQKPPTEEMRKVLVEKVDQSPYYKDRPKEREQQLINVKYYTEEEVEEHYDDLVSDRGHCFEECPICMFQKLDQALAFRYLLRKLGKTKGELLEELKGVFQTFPAFKKDILGK
jgi:hypothetical protein